MCADTDEKDRQHDVGNRLQQFLYPFFLEVITHDEVHVIEQQAGYEGPDQWGQAGEGRQLGGAQGQAEGETGPEAGVVVH